MERPYRRNVLEWAEKNPNYEISLWVSSDFLNDREFQRIKQWSIANSVHLKCGDRLIEEAGLGDLFYSELSESRYAAASDMLRFVVLYSEGGIYLDTDVLSGPRFGELDAPLGALFVYTVRTNKLGAFLPHAMASCPKHPLFPLILSRIRANYVLLNQETDIMWRYDPAPEWRYTATLSLTGKVISPACMRVTGLLDFDRSISEHLQNMRFPVALEHEESHSWIEGQRLPRHVYPRKYMDRQNADIEASAQHKSFHIADLKRKYSPGL